MATAAALLLVCAVLLLRHRRTRTRVVALSAAVLVVVGTSISTGRLVEVAHDNDVDLDYSSMLALRTQDARPDESIVYASHRGRELQLSLWHPNSTDPAASAPVVVFIHGGGWIQGSRSQATTAGHAEWFARQGYLAVSVDYSLSTERDHLWNVVEPQIGCALSWVEQNTRSRGGDPTRVALAGDSAGGNLALDAAYRASAGTLTSSCGGHVPAIHAVSTLYPVADPAGFYNNQDLLLGGTARRMAAAYTGGSPEENPQRYLEITPSTHVTSGSPPTLMVVGAADHLVPPAGAQRLAQKVREQNVPVRLVLLPGADHVFDIRESTGSQVWRTLTLRWFSDHGLAVG